MVYINITVLGSSEGREGGTTTCVCNTSMRNKI